MKPPVNLHPSLTVPLVRLGLALAVVGFLVFVVLAVLYAAWKVSRGGRNRR